MRIMNDSNKDKYPRVGVGGLVVNNNGKIFLARDKRWSGKYTIPEGYTKFGETLMNAVRREIKEKMGLDVKVVREISCEENVFRNNDKKDKHTVLVVFLCRYDGGDDRVAANEEFEGEPVWVNPEDALKLDSTVIIKNIIEKYLDYKKREKYLDNWKRCQADFENYKKAQVKAQEEFRKFANQDLITEFLPVVDNFEISLQHVPRGQENSDWMTGVDHIRKQILDVLSKNGVEEIIVKAGDKFNPEIHEAVAGDGEKQVIKKVVQRGYRFNDRIIRAAKVEVE